MADRTTAIAIFDDRTRAQRAIEQLKRAGFTEKEIGVTARDVDAADGGAGDGRIAGDGRKETHAKEGAITGVAAGAGVGALWGLGIMAGLLPAIGPAIAGGTLAAILSSAAAGAATAGIAGTLIGLGIPEDEASYYDQEFRAGRALVTVDAVGRFQEAQSILAENGGYDMRSAPMRATSGAAMAGTRPTDEARDTTPRTRSVDVPVEDDERVDAALARETIKVDKRGRATRPDQR